MPAPKTYFIPYSCFGYYDEAFDECARKCKYRGECRNATTSPEYEEVRRQYKFTFRQILELVEKYSAAKDGGAPARKKSAPRNDRRHD